MGSVDMELLNQYNIIKFYVDIHVHSGLCSLLTNNSAAAAQLNIALSFN